MIFLEDGGKLGRILKKNRPGTKIDQKKLIRILKSLQRLTLNLNSTY
jgi:hypothetical protein